MGARRRGAGLLRLALEEPVLRRARLAGGVAARRRVRVFLMSRDAGEHAEPRRLRVFDEQLHRVQHDKLRRARAHAAAEAHLGVADRAPLLTSPGPALDGGDVDGPVQLGVDQARRAPRRRRAGDAMEALSGLGRRRCGRAGALAGGGRRVGIDLVVHQVEEELAQVLLVGRVAQAQVGADVEAVRVDKEDA